MRNHSKASHLCITLHLFVSCAGKPALVRSSTQHSAAPHAAAAATATQAAAFAAAVEQLHLCDDEADPQGYGVQPTRPASTVLSACGEVKIGI